jgi:hypothetical protein
MWVVFWEAGTERCGTAGCRWLVGWHEPVAA